MHSRHVIHTLRAGSAGRGFQWPFSTSATGSWGCLACVHRGHAEARQCYAASAMHIRKSTNTAVDCDGDCFTHSDFGSQELSSVCDSTAYWGNRCATVQNCDHRSSTAGAPRQRSPTRWVVAASCIIPQCFKIVLRILAHSSRAAPEPQTCGSSRRSRVAACGQAKQSL